MGYKKTKSGRQEVLPPFYHTKIVNIEITSMAFNIVHEIISVNKKTYGNSYEAFLTKCLHPLCLKHALNKSFRAFFPSCSSFISSPLIGNFPTLYSSRQTIPVPYL